jgi:hypothetical protein
MSGGIDEREPVVNDNGGVRQRTESGERSGRDHGGRRGARGITQPRASLLASERSEEHVCVGADSGAVVRDPLLVRERRDGRAVVLRAEVVREARPRRAGELRAPASGSDSSVSLIQ